MRAANRLSPGRGRAPSTAVGAAGELLRIYLVHVAVARENKFHPPPSTRNDVDLLNNFGNTSRRSAPRRGGIDFHRTAASHPGREVGRLAAQNLQPFDAADVRVARPGMPGLADNDGVPGAARLGKLQIHHVDREGVALSGETMPIARTRDPVGIPAAPWIPELRASMTNSMSAIVLCGTESLHRIFSRDMLSDASGSISAAYWLRRPVMADEYRIIQIFSVAGLQGFSFDQPERAHSVGRRQLVERSPSIFMSIAQRQCANS